MWTFTIASSVLLTVPQQSYAKLSQKALSVHEFCNSFLFKISFIFLREGREGERKGNKHWCERETSLNFLSYAPSLRLNLQPRHMPWSGIEPMTFRFVGWCPTKWATLVSCVILNLSLPNICLARPTGKQTNHFNLNTELAHLITGSIIDWLLACKLAEFGTRCHHLKYASISFAFSPAAMLCKTHRH